LLRSVLTASGPQEPLCVPDKDDELANRRFILDLVNNKGVKLFIEYPPMWPDRETDCSLEPRQGLERLDIFLAQEGTILPTPSNRAAIVLNISNIAK
jgi:hypothetical protein